MRKARCPEHILLQSGDKFPGWMLTHVHAFMHAFDHTFTCVMAGDLKAAVIMHLNALASNEELLAGTPLAGEEEEEEEEEEAAASKTTVRLSRWYNK